MMMDGMHVMVPEGECQRLWGYEALVDAVTEFLLLPENEDIRREFVERLDGKWRREG